MATSGSGGGPWDREGLAAFLRGASSSAGTLGLALLAALLVLDSMAEAYGLEIEIGRSVLLAVARAGGAFLCAQARSPGTSAGAGAGPGARVGFMSGSSAMQASPTIESSSSVFG